VADQVGNVIDEAIAARTERSTNALVTGLGSAWTAKVMPVFQERPGGDELLAVMLEWHEASMPLPLTVDESIGSATAGNLEGTSDERGGNASGRNAPADPEEATRTGLSTNEAFRILVEAVKDYAIFLLDTRGHVTTWNIGAELNKGYRRDEILGQHFSVFYGKEDLEIGKPETELEICLREGRVEDEGWRYRKDGSRFWANVIITAVYKDGKHVGFGKVTRDLTERKAAETRLVAAYEESEKLKSDFLANMSHEIRTPMHGMLSACSLLLDTPLTDRQRDIAYIMDESGQFLLQVINDILDYSKLASGSFSINSDVVGVTSIISSVVRGVQATLQPSVHFELFLAADLPKSAQGDPLRFRQVVQNIVGNAAKFTEKGSIRVRAFVEEEDQDSYTILTEVTDTGIGISDTAATSLFTPFTQFDQTTTKRYRGTGLGLSIAKSLTELMGGRIGYQPNPERNGTVFWFTARLMKIKRLDQIQRWKSNSRNLNTGQGGDSQEQTDREANKGPTLAEVGPLRSLLLVEDNIINQKVMLGLLRAAGLKQVDLASNGAEAVAMVKAKPAAYDLVLMDINMPILDGNEATKQIRANGIRVPIVAMTAYALKGDRERCLDNGMDDYIPKPVDRQRLVKTLERWLLRPVSLVARPVPV
jgi:osomolarity two-component system sensor histidine kinase TcsA